MLVAELLVDVNNFDADASADDDVQDLDGDDDACDLRLFSIKMATFRRASSGNE